LLIELKSIGSAETLKDIIDSYLSKGWNNDDFIVCSFEHDELRRFAKICPNIKIGVLEVPFGSAEYAEKLGAYSVNVDFEGATPEFLEDAHSRGIKVFVWTVNEPEMILELEKLGADGVITDFPDKARKLLTNKPV
jgi:glycerophosphoryl diester phosphodiesterase